MSIGRQYLTSISLITGSALIGLFINDLVGYHVVAFLLLVSVSVLTLFLEIRPVLLAALLSALLWDFLFIPPRFTFTVGGTEDQLLLLTYFMVALIHAVLTHKIHQAQEEGRKKEAKANAVRFYSTLLNSLSHELRTPITTIIGAADNLQSKGGHITESDKSVLLNEVSVAAARLNQQVENLLNMSRLESGVFTVKRDWVDVRELIYHAIQRFEPTINKYRVSVHVPESLPLFKLDFGLMDQILHNLIGNVIQHTPEGTDLIITADCEEERLIIVLSDTGPGFPVADVDRVFEKFYRVEGSRPGGTGLGLSIVRGFAEAHGGMVNLRNLPLSGAEFRIEIPAEVSYLNGLKNE
ncbi:MAG TPA: ATP-binding protein [Cyclobacteriaceae bacterium]|nr:ATP-binding protein [Cyclobacteriaceae bacterium]